MGQYQRTQPRGGEKKEGKAHLEQATRLRYYGYCGTGKSKAMKGIKYVENLQPLLKQDGERQKGASCSHDMKKAGGKGQPGQQGERKYIHR